MSETNLNKSNNNQSKEIQIYSNESASSPTAILNPFAQCGESTSRSEVIMETNHNIDGRTAGASTSDPINGSHASDSSNNILDRLNDDCLIKVFEYLPLSDLCTAADVCSVFQSNALAFKRKFSDIDFNEFKFIDEHNIDILCEWDAERDSLLPMDSVERLFRHFGVLIQTIHLDKDDFDKYEQDRIMELMIAHCAHKNSKLNKLVMYGITISSHLMPRLQSLFDRLKSLDITDGSFYFGSELTELILDDVDLDCSFVRTLKKLQTISVTDVRESYVGLFDDFLALNPQLKSLTRTDSKGPTSRNRYRQYFERYEIKTDFSLIGALSELEELRLHSQMKALHEDKDLNNLSRLQHLKVFSCDCSGLLITELLNNFTERNVPIEELDLRNFTLDFNIASNLAKFIKMKKLSFSDGQAESGQLSNAVKGMLHLEKLCLSNFENVSINDIKATIENALDLNELLIDLKEETNEEFIVNTKDFNEICQFIVRRQKRIKFNLTISGSQCKLHVPESIIKRNRWLLEVKLITFKDVQPMDVIEYYDDSDQSESSDHSVEIDADDDSDQSESIDHSVEIDADDDSNQSESSESNYSNWSECLHDSDDD